MGYEYAIDEQNKCQTSGPFFAEGQRNDNLGCNEFVEFSGEMEEIRRLISRAESFDRPILVLRENGCFP